MTKFNRFRDMERLVKELADLKAPELPRPVPEVRDPAFQAWRKAFQDYVDKKDRLIKAIDELGGFSCD